MHNFPAKAFTIALFILMSNAIHAQTSSISNPNSERENNPYSKYGIGELWNGNNTALKGMGNITSAFQDPFLINSDNPASYSSLALTTFEGGALGSTRNIVAATGQSYTSGTASLGYLSIGIPINQKGGLSLGLRPYAKSYFALLDTIASPSGQVMRSYAGDGGLSYAYLGASYRIKGLSLGFNLGYMFGTYRKFTSVIGIDSLSTNDIYEAQFAKYNSIGGLYWKGGFMYERKLKDSDYVFRVGGTLTLGQNLNETVSQYRVSIKNFGDTLVNDTSYSDANNKGTLKLPMSYSIGVMLAKSDKWAFGLDYSATNWSQFNSSKDTAMNYGIASSNYKIAAGAQFTPNSADLLNYFSRVTYRMGVYYGTEYVRLQNIAMPVYGLTFGGSFPYKRNTRAASRLHASFDIGRLGTTSNNLLKQTYVRFGLGLSFNEKWFIPRKYE